MTTPVRQGSKSMKVLLSDSNLITSSKVSSLLKSQGWEVFSASRWTKAKEILQENPDISVAVINLEGFGGLELLENLKKENPEVKVIAYCGHMNLPLQSKAQDLGADIVVPNSVIVNSAAELVAKLTS